MPFQENLVVQILCALHGIAAGVLLDSPRRNLLECKEISVSSIFFLLFWTYLKLTLRKYFGGWVEIAIGCILLLLCGLLWGINYVPETHIRCAWHVQSLLGGYGCTMASCFRSSSICKKC